MTKPFGPPPPEGGRADRRRVRFRDLVSVAVVGAGTVALMVCLYFLSPLLAASVVCVAVIAGGVAVGMD